MKQFNGYDDAKKNAQYQGSSQLPLGTYVCKIVNVQYQESQNGGSDMINVLFDVAEGEQKDFYKNQYDNSQDEDKKWKGRTTIWVPTDDGSEKDGWTKNSFARWTDGFEKSNPGYAWDWDEKKWKGKLIALRFRKHGIVTKEGSHILFNDVDRPFDVEWGRKNSDSVGKDRFDKGFDINKVKGKNNSNSGGEDFLNIPEGTDEEIPF